jgi:hypothetical protein
MTPEDATQDQVEYHFDRAASIIKYMVPPIGKPSLGFRQAKYLGDVQSRYAVMRDEYMRRSYSSEASAHSRHCELQTEQPNVSVVTSIGE